MKMDIRTVNRAFRPFLFLLVPEYGVFSIPAWHNEHQSGNLCRKSCPNLAFILLFYYL